MADGYASTLRWALRHQALMLCVLLGTVCLAVYLYMVIPKGFFPQQDTGRLSGQALSARGYFLSNDAAEARPIHGHRPERSRR